MDPCIDLTVKLMYTLAIMKTTANLELVLVESSRSQGYQLLPVVIDYIIIIANTLITITGLKMRVCYLRGDGHPCSGILSDYFHASILSD